MSAAELRADQDRYADTQAYFDAHERSDRAGTATAPAARRFAGHLRQHHPQVPA